MYNDSLPADPRELPLITAAQRAASLPDSGGNVQVAIFEPSGPRSLWYRMTLAEFLSSIALAGVTLTSPTISAPTLSGVVKLGSSDTRTGAGAVSVTAVHTELVTTGADALTLANGTDGQLKVITMKTDGGDGTLTPTTPSGFSTIAFSAVGQSATLLYKTGVGWIILAVRGATVA